METEEITNHQIPMTKQAPITNHQTKKKEVVCVFQFGDSVIGAWNLFGAWNLVFGDSTS
jgi:hypothetical protein